jgi:hypothetical protein
MLLPLDTQATTREIVTNAGERGEKKERIRGSAIGDLSPLRDNGSDAGECYNMLSNLKTPAR